MGWALLLVLPLVALAAGEARKAEPPQAPARQAPEAQKARQEAQEAPQKVRKTEEQWKALLTPEQFQVLRKQGTERAFSGKYWDHHEEGTYHCAGCGQALFSSAARYDSGTGWPSYWQPVSPSAVELREDRGWFMTRTEVVCSRCGGHLGHVFDDGPQPTGLRYCMNSAALSFQKKE